MNSKLILFLVSCAILIVVGSYDVNYFDYESPIPHSRWTEINWANFKGKNKPYFTLHGEGEFAFIHTDIELVQHDTFMEVTTYFHPSRSYVFNRNIMDKSLLRHELYHFHIAEYSARLLRKELSNPLVLQRISPEDLLDRYKYKEDSLQRAYDQESEHAFRLGNQKNWEKKIDSCLLSTEKYASTIIQLKTK